MWLFTTFGFFSATEVSSKFKPSKGEKLWPEGTLQIRARVWEDLENLREKYLPELSETIHLPSRDYPYRGYCSKSEFAAALVQAALDINYSNFKNEVSAQQGRHRSHMYGDIWNVMYRAEEKLADEERKEEERRQKASPFRQRALPEYLEPWIEDIWKREAEAEETREVTAEIDLEYLWRDNRTDDELQAAAEESVEILVDPIPPEELISEDPMEVQEAMMLLEARRQ